MIVAMQNFIPDRPAASSDKKSPPAPIHHQIYAAAWLNKEEDSPAIPASPAAWKFAPSSAAEAPQTLAPASPPSTTPLALRKPRQWLPYVPSALQFRA